MRRSTVNQILVIGLTAHESSLIQRHFAGREIVCVRDAQDGPSLVQRGGWDFIFAFEPKAPFVDACVKAHVPLVVVTEKPRQLRPRQNAVIESMTREHLVPQFLSPLISGMRERGKWESITRLTQESFQLNDESTGTFHRQYLEMRLAEEAERSQRFGFPVTLAVFTLEDADGLSERFGEAGLTDILKHCAKILTRDIRASDLLARIGDCSFGLLLPHTNSEGAAVVAERLVETVKAHPAVTASGNAAVTLSVACRAVIGTASNLDDVLKCIEEEPLDRSMSAS